MLSLTSLMGQNYWFRFRWLHGSDGNGLKQFWLKNVSTKNYDNLQDIDLSDTVYLVPSKRTNINFYFFRKKKNKNKRRKRFFESVRFQFEMTAQTDSSEPVPALAQERGTRPGPQYPNWRTVKICCARCHRNTWNNSNHQPDETNSNRNQPLLPIKLYCWGKLPNKLDNNNLQENIRTENIGVNINGHRRYKKP